MPMAIPLIAAGLSVSAGIAAGGIIGGLMIAGGAMTAIGTVTGNAKLAKLGGIVSLVGGIGALATSFANGAASAVGSEVAASSAIEAEAGIGTLGGSAPTVAPLEGLGVETTAMTAPDLAPVPRLNGVEATAPPPMAGAPADNGLIGNNMGANPPSGAISGSDIGGASEQFITNPDPASSGTGGLVPSARPLASSLGDTTPNLITDAPAAPTSPGNPAPVVDTSASSSPGAATNQQMLEGYTQYQNSMTQAGQRSLGGAPDPSLWDQYGKPAAEFINKNPGVAMMGGQAIAGAGQAYSQAQAQDKQLALLEEQRKRLNSSILALKMPRYQKPT